MKPLIQQLTATGPILADGAWGTELQKMGLAPGVIADGWNLSHPERVEEVARSYVEAGSGIVLTNTFRANRVALAGHELAGKIKQVNRAGVKISRRAAGNRARVFASIGPSGKLLMAEEIGREELQDAFAEQANSLAEASPDALVIETMSDLVEAGVALEAARATGLPVVVCMVFDSGKNQDRTLTGVTPELAAKELTAQGADVIGANCGKGIDAFIDVCRRLHAATDRPIWIKPNAGMPRLSGDSVVYDTTPEAFASHVPSLIEAGAAFIGGCCGTNSQFIRAMSQHLHSRLPVSTS
jgi:5-methyltetrahydrofolate--homocysteine methyltransferase